MFVFYYNSRSCIVKLARIRNCENELSLNSEILTWQVKVASMLTIFEENKNGTFSTWILNIPCWILDIQVPFWCHAYFHRVKIFEIIKNRGFLPGTNYVEF